MVEKNFGGLTMNGEVVPALAWKCGGSGATHTVAVIRTRVVTRRLAAWQPAVGDHGSCEQIALEAAGRSLRVEAVGVGRVWCRKCAEWSPRPFWRGFQSAGEGGLLDGGVMRKLNARWRTASLVLSLFLSNPALVQAADRDLDNITDCA